MRRASVFAMLSRMDVSVPARGSESCMSKRGAGLPVVAGDVAGALDAVVDGQTGFLVDPKDHVAAADAVVSILLSLNRAAHGRSPAASTPAHSPGSARRLGSRTSWMG